MFSLLKRRGACDLSGGQVTVTMWLSKNVPRRILVSLPLSVTYKDWTRGNTHWSIVCKYVLTEVSISPAAHTVSPHLIHPHPAPGSYGRFLQGLYHLSAVQNYLWPGLALFSKTATMPAPWMSLEGAAVPTVWPENSSCRYTSHQPRDTARLPSAQLDNVISRIPAQQEPLLPT